MINLLGKVSKMGKVLETLSDIKESGDNLKIAKIEAEKEVLVERIRDKKAFDLEILNQKKDKVDGGFSTVLGRFLYIEYGEILR